MSIQSYLIFALLVAFMFFYTPCSNNLKVAADKVLSIARGGLRKAYGKDGIPKEFRRCITKKRQKCGKIEDYQDRLGLITSKCMNEARHSCASKHADKFDPPYTHEYYLQMTDPCLKEGYAEDNYGTCCANNGYKKPGHGEICKIVGRRVKKA